VKRPLVLHPLLIGVYPILFLYAHNPGEMKASQIVLLLVASLGLSLLIWLILNFWLKNWAKAGLITSIIVFLLFTYGHLSGLLGKQGISLAGPALPIVGMILALGCCIYFVRRSRSDFRAGTHVLNIVAAVLIALNAFPIVSYQLELSRLQEANERETDAVALSWIADWNAGRGVSQTPSAPGVSEQAKAAAPLSAADQTEQIGSSPSVIDQTAYVNPDETPPTAQNKSRPVANDQVVETIPGAAASQPTAKTPMSPDVYFIVLDEYASPEVIKKYYGYDNEPFVEELQGQGFFVADQSRTQYNDTMKSISTVLNMKFTPKDEIPGITYQRLSDNQVVSNFRSLGYKFIYFGHWFEIGRYDMHADTSFNFYGTESSANPVAPELWSTLWNTTILDALSEESHTIVGENVYRDGLIHTLDQLAETPAMEGPKFIYAHIMVPHSPFVFGPNGEHLDSRYVQNHPEESYLGQYIFITHAIEKAVSDILSKSSAEPIIILQSDHGPKQNPEWNKILNAYHLPGGGKVMLDGAISPVNSFRIIFDYYFNANYELLEDRLP
jgi:hypothetical protein